MKFKMSTKQDPPRIKEVDLDIVMNTLASNYKDPELALEYLLEFGKIHTVFHIITVEKSPKE